MWNFISGSIKEGSEIFIDNEGLIKQLPSALSVHVYRLVWKHTLFLAHNMVIWVVLMFVFPRPLGWHLLLAIPGLALLVINGVWVSMFFGIIATRYRDVAPLPRLPHPAVVLRHPHRLDDRHPHRSRRRRRIASTYRPTQPPLPLHGSLPIPPHRSATADLPLVGCYRVHHCRATPRPLRHETMAIPRQLLGLGS